MQMLVTAIQDLLLAIAAETGSGGNLLSGNDAAKRAFNFPYDKSGTLTLEVPEQQANFNQEWDFGFGIGPPWEVPEDAPPTTAGAATGLQPDKKGLYPVDPQVAASRRLEVFGGAPGFTQVQYETSNQDGTGSRYGLVRISVPHFVVVYEKDGSQANREGSLSDIGLLPVQDLYLQRFKAIAEDVLAQVANVRIIWQVGPLNDSLPPQYDPALSPGYRNGRAKIFAIGAHLTGRPGASRTSVPAGPIDSDGLFAMPERYGEAQVSARPYDLRVFCANRYDSGDDDWVKYLRERVLAGTATSGEFDMFLEVHARHDALVFCHEVLHCVGLEHNEVRVAEFLPGEYPADQIKDYPLDIMNSKFSDAAWLGYLRVQVSQAGIRNLDPADKVGGYDHPVPVGIADLIVPDTSGFSLHIYDLLPLEGLTALPSIVAPWQVDYLNQYAPIPGNSGPHFQ